jgi:endonuclease/exonuclease/phosphatase family metal-dependent hydrolase
LLWNWDVQVTIQNYSLQHINATIQHHSDVFQWKLTCFYGHPEVAKRHEAWALLIFLSRMSPEPWLCVGDFNEILSLSEKSSSTARPRSQMLAFHRALEDCQLLDLGFRGSKYTWCNECSGGEYNKEWLDRVVASHGWSSFFNVIEVQVLAHHCSDHSPLLVSYARTEDVTWRKYKTF